MLTHIGVRVKPKLKQSPYGNKKTIQKFKEIGAQLVQAFFFIPIIHKDYRESPVDVTQLKVGHLYGQISQFLNAQLCVTRTEPYQTSCMIGSVNPFAAWEIRTLDAALSQNPDLPVKMASIRNSVFNRLFCNPILKTLSKNSIFANSFLFYISMPFPHYFRLLFNRTYLYV